MISGNLNALLRKFHFLGVYQYWYTIYPYWYTLYQYWYNDTNIGINIPKSGKSILLIFPSFHHPICSKKIHLFSQKISSPLVLALDGQANIAPY